MKYLQWKISILQKDIIKIIILAPILALLANIIYINNPNILLASNFTEFQSTLYGSVSRYSSNWVYWLILSIGYIITLQLIWKTNTHMFEIQLILRSGTLQYWITNCLLGFLLTIYFIYCFFAMNILFCSQNNISINLNIQSFLILNQIIFNLYIHSLFWLILKMFFSAEIANIVIIILLYLGVQVLHPFIPLYYSMIDNTHKYQGIVQILQFFISLFMILLILKKAKKTDYY